MFSGRDREYATQCLDEMVFLKSRNIPYVFCKRIGEEQVLTFKYKKTPELFRAVADFYEQRQLTKEFSSLSNSIEAV